MDAAYYLSQQKRRPSDNNHSICVTHCTFMVGSGTVLRNSSPTPWLDRSMLCKTCPCTQALLSPLLLCCMRIPHRHRHESKSTAMLWSGLL